MACLETKDMSSLQELQFLLRSSDFVTVTPILSSQTVSQRLPQANERNRRQMDLSLARQNGS
jgi:hypothetical protein